MKYTYEFLRRCDGIRFRAKWHGRPIDGMIRVFDGTMRLYYGAGNWLADPTIEGFAKYYIIPEEDYEEVFSVDFSDFEIVPRDPATYKDWHVGDKIASRTNNKGGEVIFRCEELVIYKDKDDGRAAGPFTCSELFRGGYRLVLTDIEKQILEEKERGKFTLKDGDICYSHLPMPTIFIKEGDECNNRYYRAYVPAKDYLSNGSGRIVPDNFQISIRPATDAEKQQLFDALAKTGKRWNAEKKVVEDIPAEPEPAKHKFKKFDPVLMRDGDDEQWEVQVFGRYGVENEAFPYFIIDGPGYLQCIPLNEKTEHLICTSNPYKEE